METKVVFFQFEIIIYVLVSASLEYLYICMLWVYGHYKYFYSFSAGIDLDVRSDVCRRQVLTSKVDPHAVRINNNDVFSNLKCVRCVFIMYPYVGRSGTILAIHSVNIQTMRWHMNYWWRSFSVIEPFLRILFNYPLYCGSNIMTDLCSTSCLNGKSAFYAQVPQHHADENHI